MRKKDNEKTTEARGRLTIPQSVRRETIGIELTTVVINSTNFHIQSEIENNLYWN